MVLQKCCDPGCWLGPRRVNEHLLSCHVRILIVASYVLFSIGNVKPLFQAAFRSCWGSGSKICNSTWIYAVDYLEICGIIVGQILVGILGDW